MNAKPLQGQVVWVTGSARRVGRVIALEAARAGADLVVHCNRSVAEGEAVVAEIRAMGARAMLVRGDHSKRTEVEGMIDNIDRTFGRLDALVNSASTFPRQDFEKITDADFDDTINANLRGPFLCTQLALPLLRAANPGRVVNMLDCRHERPYAHHAGYWSAKGGLVTLTRALARELAPRVLVNGVAPGPVLKPEDYSDERVQSVAERTMLKRWGTPEDVGRAVCFLLASTYLTGVIIPVDGGYGQA